MTFVLKKYLNIENKSKIHYLSDSNQIIQTFEEKLDCTWKDFFKIIFNPNNSIVLYFYLFNDKNKKIIALHNKLYNNDDHKFN